MKDLFSKKNLNIFSIIIGVLFIVSGFGKAIDVSGFTALITQYGLGAFSFLAPVIILFEILLGLSLILLMNPKRDSLISFVMLIVFTVLFGFAHFTYGVNDCGCFGTIKTTNLPPLFSFIRNLILIVMSGFIIYNYPKDLRFNPSWKKYLIISLMFVSVFITGLSVKSPLFTKSVQFVNAEGPEMKVKDQNIKNTELGKYLTTSPNKDYLFFCFSYSCSYCWNSIENLRSFIRNNAVDSVVIFAVGSDSERKIFEDKFKPDFPVTILSTEAMNKLTFTYPTGFYIENDTIKIIAPGQLSSPFVFESVIANVNKK